MYFFTNSFGMKCRPTSKWAPRQRKRGRSSIVTAGISHSVPATVAERKIANFIARHGEDTKTAGMQNEDARRLEELYPGRFTQELHAPEMLRAKQRLSLGFGGQGGLHHRVLPPLTHNIEPLMATGYLLGRRAPVLYPLIPTIGTLPGGDE